MNIYHLKRIRKDLEVKFIESNRLVLINHKKKKVDEYRSIPDMISKYLRIKYGPYTSLSYLERKEKIILDRERIKKYNTYIIKK